MEATVSSANLRYNTMIRLETSIQWAWSHCNGTFSTCFQFVQLRGGKPHWKHFWLYFLARRRKIGDAFFAQIGIISFYSFHNVPSQYTALKRKLIHHTTQRACRRQFVGLSDHVMRSTHLRLQYRKTLLWRTVDVHASTHTQYASHDRYFKLLKRCIKLSRFKYHCLWMKHWSGRDWVGSGGYLQHSATGDYNIDFVVVVVVYWLYCDCVS